MFCSWESKRSSFAKFPWGEVLLRKETLLDVLFQISSESPSMNGLVSLAVLL